MAMLHLFVLNAVILFFPLITDDTVLFHCAWISRNINLFMCDKVT
jgi:hypothetical protein